MYDPNILNYKFPFDEQHENLQDVVPVGITLLICRAKNIAETESIVTSIIAVAMLSGNVDIDASIMTGFTPIHGFGNYVAIRIANQKAYDQVVKSGLLDNFLPDVYTVPVFDLYKSANVTFVMNLANTDQYAQRVAETILVPQSSQLLDSCVDTQGFFLVHPYSDAALVSIDGVRHLLSQE